MMNPQASQAAYQGAAMPKAPSWFSQNGSNLMGGLGGIASGIFSMNQANPADAAKPYLDQIPGVYQQYLNPYVQGGQRSYGTLENQFNQLTNDPSAMMAKFGSQFQQSPGYQFQVDQAREAANRAAAAGGMLGSPMEQEHVAGITNQLANQDYYNYLSHVLGMYGQGLQGLGGLNQMGFQGANQLADAEGNALASQANLAMASQQNQNQAQAGGWGQILGGIGSMAGMFMGGPAGSAIGGTAGNALGSAF